MAAIGVLPGFVGCADSAENATGAGADGAEDGTAGAASDDAKPDGNAPAGGDETGAGGQAAPPVKVIAPPDAAGDRGGFADLPGFDMEDRPSRCVRPLLIGHRGSRFRAPENTLPAYMEAMASGGDGVEIDVRVTADGALVAFHDSRSAATTDDDDNRLVSELTLEALQALDAGSWFAPEWAGTRVPTIEAVIDALPQDATFVFDVKSNAGTPLARLVAERGLESRSVFAASELETLRTVREALPDARLLFFAADVEALATAEAVDAHYVRVPVEEQHLERQHWALADAGYEPVVSSTYLTWNVGMVFVNDMRNGVARRQQRQPEACR